MLSRRSVLSAILPAVVAGLALAGTTGTARAQNEMKIGLLTINDPQHFFSDRFAEEVAKRTGGRITAKVFPAGQLGSIPREIEGLQFGTQEGFITPPGFLQGINPAFTVTDAPGIFENTEHAFKSITDPEFRDKFLKLAEPAGIIGVGMFASAFNSIASREPLRTLDDFKGKKIRVLASKTEIEMVKRLGLTGVPMSYDEVLPALQQGTIDAALSAHTVMATSKFPSVTKYITFLGGSFIESILFVSKVWFDKQTPADQKTIMEIGRSLERPITDEAIKFSDKAWKDWKDSGAEIIQLSAADRAEMMKRIRPIGDEILATNPRTKEMYELLKKVAAKHHKAG
jgi:C4-dicarboxylate-binding protein DctP